MAPYASNQRYYNLQCIDRTKNPFTKLELLPYGTTFGEFLQATIYGIFLESSIGFHLSRKHAICRCSLTFLNKFSVNPRAPFTMKRGAFNTL